MHVDPNNYRRVGATIALAWLLVAALLAMSASAVASPATRPAIEAVDHVSIVVSDADRAIDFYTRVLDFKLVSDSEVAGRDLEALEGVFGARCRGVRLTLGDESIELIEYLTPKGRPIPTDSRSNDRWFQHVAIITSDMDKAYARLRSNKVRHASTGPQRLPDWNPNAGGIRAFYFHDPDSHVLEILQFPEGKGDARWHRNDRLFLGIDHTAIVTSDTSRSLTFYRDLLGMRVAGTSENWGDQQEHLNNVFGAHLRITTLRAAKGPGVELLEYLSPHDGRPFPTDARSNDLFNWQTVVRSSDAQAAFHAARGCHVPLVSPAVVHNSLDREAAVGFIFRDFDGHAVELIQSSQVTQPGRS